MEAKKFPQTLTEARFPSGRGYRLDSVVFRCFLEMPYRKINDLRTQKILKWAFYDRIS
jgi:hypothetical protein